MRHLEMPLTPYPTGRPLSGRVPGTSCQATFIQSLRDKPKHFLDAFGQIDLLKSPGWHSCIGQGSQRISPDVLPRSNLLDRPK
jgi:hypothetical protein